jgi:signal transduction histidine kinase/ligand-binding sensor domain-containing protein
MKKLLTLILVSVLFQCSKAQGPHLYFDHISIKEGLPEGQVRVIKEDSEGYIWLSTQNGLVCYDGYQYQVYNLGSAKLNFQAYTNVQSIFEDKHKTVWVSTTYNGLFKYNRQTDTFQQFVYSTDKRVSGIFGINTEDNEGNIWGIYHSAVGYSVAKFNVKTNRFGFFNNRAKGVNYLNITHCYPIRKTADGAIWFSSNNGLYRYNGDGKGFTGYLTSNDTAKQISINPIYEAPSEPGILWMNTFHGNNINLKVAKFDMRAHAITAEYVHGIKPGDIKCDSVNAIYEDKKKQLWFSTQQGLSKFNRAAKTFTNYLFQDTVRSNLKNQFSKITEAKDGTFWIISQLSLVYFDPATGFFKRYLGDNTPGSLTPGVSASQMIDHTGTLWVSVGYDGIFKVNRYKSAFKVYEKSGSNQGYPGGTPQLSPAGDGSYWLNTSGGIYKWAPGTNVFKKVLTINIPDQYQTNVCTGDNHIIYTGTKGGMLAYNTLTGQQQVIKLNFKDTTNSRGTGVTLVFRSHDGMIWIGTDRGLCAFDPVTQKLTHYPYLLDGAPRTKADIGKLDDQRVLSLYEDHEHTIWAGTNAGGLNRLNRVTGKFTSYFNTNNPGLTCIINLYEDKAGRFWAGTYLRGLFEFNRKSGVCTRNINEASGLLHNTVDGIIEDASGKLWILSERGFSQYDPNTGIIKEFKAENILPGKDVYDTGLNPSFYTTGIIPYAVRNGLAVFDPKDLLSNPFPPVVHLQNIMYSNPMADSKTSKNISAYGLKMLELPFNQNRIHFYYIGLHYDNPAQNQYAYKLDGYDKDWIQAGSTRNVTYTNLSPGTYTFHVIAANSDGVWNTVGDSVTIIIHTSLWMRWWAWLIYIILFAAAIYAFIAYRSRHLIQANLLLEEKINKRTQQLSEANHELSEQQEEIITQRDRLAETVNELKTAQQQLIQSEKLASLGELTAGIAHEIQNPLNFVNNFSEVNTELLDEMQEEIEKGNYDEVKAIAEDIKGNQLKINHHGKRADAIVKNMLEHSRNNSGEKQPTNINTLADEYLRLSYHGLRAKDKTFNAELITNFDENLPKLAIIPQDIGRVLLNLFNNAFYAVQQKQKLAVPDYKPTITLSTFASPLNSGGWAVSVKDNGTGIPDDVKEKILQPFFTTKPTGEGTGLGLSLSYDIVVKGHGGKLEVNTKEGEFTEFIIYMPA